MLCDEVIRELAAPTDDRDATALAGHLSECPACSAWAGRAARLDRLWEDTRPADPAPEVWLAAWDRITRSLDRPEMARPETNALNSPAPNGSQLRVGSDSTASRLAPRPGRYRFARIALIGVAQAAAVLVAVGLSWHTPEPGRMRTKADPVVQLADRKHPDAIAPTVADIEIEEGQLIVIREEGSKPEVVDLTPEMRPWGADPWYVMHNMMESASNPKVAMKE